MESGGNFTYATASSGDLYIKLPQNVSIRSRAWLQEMLKQIIRCEKRTVLYSTEKMILQVLKSKYQSLEQTCSAIIGLAINSLYYSGESPRFFLFYKLLLGELPGWLWNYFELLCKTIDETCGEEDEEVSVS